MKKRLKIMLISLALLAFFSLCGVMVFQQHFKPSPYRHEPLPVGEGLVVTTEYPVYHKGEDIRIVISNPTGLQFAYERMYSVECKLFGQWYLYYQPDAVPYDGIMIQPHTYGQVMYLTTLPDSFFTFPGEYRIITNDTVASFTVE